MRRPGPLFASDDGGFRLPSSSAIDSKLVIGSALFGIGWGLGGLCTGPAISSLLLAPGDAVLFVMMMLAGLAVGRMLTGGPAATPAAQA